MIRIVIIAWLAGLSLWGVAKVSRADVVVISNRMEQPIEFIAGGARGQQARRYKVPATDLVAIPVTADLTVRYLSDGVEREFSLPPNSVFYFGKSLLGIELQQISFPGDAHFPFTQKATTTESSPPVSKEAGRVALKLYVDDEEVAQQSVWEAKLRRRVEAASKVIQQHCGMWLEVVAVSRWDSDDRITDFEQSLREFIRESQPQPARLAIGFTSQYQRPSGPTKLGGIPAPFYPYMLIREWPQHFSEPERLEVLLHELGHYLGAVHSPERSSAVRPVVGDRQANANAFRLGYDPVNTLAMNLVCQEVRTRGVWQMSDLTYRTKARLTCLYTALAAALPEDETALRYIRWMGIPTPRIEEHINNARRQAASAGGS